MTPDAEGLKSVPDTLSSLNGGRKTPSRWQSIGLFVRADMEAIWRSWLCRGFFCGKRSDLAFVA